MTLLFQDKGTNLDIFPDFAKKFVNLYNCRKFHADMAIYSRDKVDGTCILYILCIMPVSIGSRSQNNDIINL